MELLNSKGQLLDDLRRGIQLVAPDLKLVSKRQVLSLRALLIRRPL